MELISDFFNPYLHYSPLLKAPARFFLEKNTQIWLLWKALFNASRFGPSVDFGTHIIIILFHDIRNRPCGVTSDINCAH